MNAAHHQNGAEPSVIAVTRSEIHPNPRWFSTSGTRSSSRGTGGGVRVGVAFSAIRDQCAPFPLACPAPAPAGDGLP